MKRRVRSRLEIYYLLVIGFSFFVFSCVENDKPEIQSERVEGKQLMENNSTHANEADVKEGSSSGTEEYELGPISDQIQLQFEEWKPLVEELKTALGEIKEGAEKAR